MLQTGNDQGDKLAISRASRGDPDAFRLLVERHARAVFRLAYRMTSNENDAQDLVQETFLKAWKQIGKFDGRASFSTWLHRICANCSLDHLRGRQRKRETEIAEGFDPVGHDPSPERLAISVQVSERLEPALSQLSGMERTAFVLRHYEGKSIEEISGILGVEAGAAKHSVFRAVQKLRRALEPVMSAAR